VQVRIRPSVLAVTERIAFEHSLKWLLHDHEFFVHVTDSDGAFSQTQTTNAGAFLIDVAPSISYAGNIIRRLRTRVGSAPIIAVGNDETSYEIAYLQRAGADDHLARKERLQLVLRIRQQLRLVTDVSQGLIFPVIELDDESMRAQVRGRSVQLTSNEYALLARLVKQPNCIVPTVDLLRDVRWERARVNEGRLRACIRLLRHKLEDDPRHPRRLLTVLDNGYIFRPDA
jgi:DNA-binding response OmpR family regulator